MYRGYKVNNLLLTFVIFHFPPLFLFSFLCKGRPGWIFSPLLQRGLGGIGRGTFQRGKLWVRDSTKRVKVLPLR